MKGENHQNCDDLCTHKSLDTMTTREIKAWAVLPVLEDGTDMLKEMSRYNLAHYPIFAGKQGAKFYIQGLGVKYKHKILPVKITYTT